MHILPLDLHILIQSFLDPCDIISLRMTSKTLYLATQRRVVWLSALRRVCVDHALFEPTFPTQNMTTRELEYGALSPARVSAEMKKGTNGTKATPLKNRTFCAPQFQKYNQISLIPGGRYLLAGSYEPHCGMSLWDLGTNAACPLPLSPIATIPEGFGSISNCPTSDGFGILVTTYFVDADASHTITVYEIYPSAAEPQFCHRGNLKLSHLSAIYSQIGYHFVSLDTTQVLTFWDIQLNKTFTWDAPFKVEELFLLESQLVILSETQITLWEIPFLKGIAGNNIPDDEFVKHFPPILKLGHSFTTGPNIPRLFSVPPQWWPMPHDTIIGSVASEDGVSEMTLHRLDVDKLASGGLITEIGVLSSIPLRMVHECDFLFGLRFCNKELCQLWQPDEDALISLLPIPTSREEKCAVTTRILFSGPIFDFNFCPASGRLVVVEEDEIRVLDFIAPISEVSQLIESCFPFDMERVSGT